MHAFCPGWKIWAMASFQISLQTLQLSKQYFKLLVISFSLVANFGGYWGVFFVLQYWAQLFVIQEISVCPAVLLSVCGGQLPSILWKLIVWTVSLIFLFFCFPSIWKWNPIVFKLGLCQLSLPTLLILRAAVLHLGEAPDTHERMCLSSLILPQSWTHCSPEFCGRLIRRAVSECKCITLYGLSIG